MKKHFMITFGLLSLLLLVVACTPQPVIVEQTGTGSYVETQLFDPTEEVTETSFNSMDELEVFLEAHQSSGYYGGVMMRSDVMIEEAVETMAIDGAAPTAKLAGSNDYSETNVQVAGVDEGDIIKTDGEYIYTVSGKTLFIIQAYPGEEAEILTSFALEKGNPSSLFINDDILVVFGSVNDYDLFDELDFRPTSGMTYFEVYDISDKEDPTLVKEYLFEGRYFNSRMIDNTVYIVAQSYPRATPRPVPLYFEDGAKREVALSSISYMPIPYDSVSFVTINAIDLADLDMSSETLVVEANSELYMSENNMYLAYTKYINEWDIQQKVAIELVTPRLSDSDKALIEKIKQVDNDVLSQAEKEQKIYAIIAEYVQYLSSDEQDALEEEIEQAVKKELEQYDYFEYTIINKVAVNKLKIDPVAHAKVPGQLNNQFSMDEYNNVLRVATTVNSRWSRYASERTDSENFVFTLDEDLELLDSLDNIAKTERIYSTRFMGDKLYMVTFRQVDPFFVIDLSDPNNIESLGELKIPGFSRYLHPYDENTIIGIGRDATESGRTQGLKISLFDVSDVSNPEEVAQFVTEENYASSTAEYEHKAFLFSKEKNLLVIPAYSHDYKNNDGYNGAFVFDISKDSIELRGLIDHSKGAQYSYGAAVERSLYIEDLLYTKSYGLLRINNLDDLAGVKNIELEQAKNGNIPVY